MSTRIIKINRGDSFEFTIDAPELSANDGVYFAIVYPNRSIEEAVLIKGVYTQAEQAEEGKIKVKLTPNDTRHIAVGVYYYTVKLQKGGSLADLGTSKEPDEVITLVERTKFIVND